MTERRSVEIDYCPHCRGVWLDRGELDKLIALDGEAAESQASQRGRRDERRDHDERHHDNRYRHEDYRNGRLDHRKKRSLVDMFDFD